MGACGTTYDDTYTVLTGGDVIDQGDYYGHHTMVVFAYGDFNSLILRFEMSHDNSNWTAVPGVATYNSSVNNRVIEINSVARYVRAFMLEFDGNDVELLVTIASA